MKKTRKIISLLLSILMIITAISALSITSAAAYYESEPNDSISTADSISTNSTVYGVSNTSSDYDYYKFSLSSKGYITITMNHAQLDYGSWYVCLYDTNGNKLYSWQFNATYASNSTEKIGLPAGTYYVDIEYNYNVVGVDYNFKVNYTQSNYWESESNDSRTKADNISVNTTYYGVSNTSSDYDYYKFSLSSQGYITITMNHDKLDYGSWHVCLYDTNGKELYSWQFNATYASNSTEKIGLPAGTYYVDIEYGYNVKGVDYSFIVEQPLFPDVRSGDWYFNAVKFNAEKGYVTGYSNGTFGPSNNIQRQDFVLILARIAGANLSAYKGQNGGFSDVQAGAYYASAVAWAKDKGIVTGYSADNFGVGTYITREQISLILCRYLNGSASGDVDAILNAYSDGGNTSPWAKAGVAWAVENGIIGNSDYLNPNGNAGRAEVAQIIYNMSNKGML